MSNVPDTTTKIRFVNDNKEFDTNGVQWVINPWDELALTRAMELKEANAGIEKITVMNVGEKVTEATLRKALAVGADNAIRIESKPTDAFHVAYQLAEAIKKDSYDIIMCGIESADYNGNAVGGMLSEMLDMPSVSSVSGLNIENGKVTVKREIDGGQETINIETPFVAIVQKGIAIEPKIPAMRGIMMARKKPLEVLEAAAADNFTNHNEYELPPAKAECKMVDAENVKELVDLLKNEAKAL